MRLDQYDDCEVEYLSTSYSVLNQKEIFILKPHHINLSVYNNIDRDFDEWFKTKIKKFRKKHKIQFIVFIPVICIQFRTNNDKYYTIWLVPHYFNCI
jgi:hypothetical protein